MEPQIVSIATRLGSTVLNLAEIAEKFGKAKDEKALRRCGTTNLYRFREDESLEQSAIDASREAVYAVFENKPKIDRIYSCVATSQTRSRIPGLARIVGDALGLGNIPMINLSMGCAGGIHVLETVEDKMWTDHKGHNYLLVVGDHTSKVLDPESWDTAGIFSDGVAAVVVSNNIEGPYSIRAVESTNLEGDIHSMNIDTHDGIFRMRGDQVYNFAVNKVFPACMELLELDNLDDCHYVVPHQASGAVLLGMQRKHKIPESQFYTDGIKRIGNIPGASIFFSLKDVIDRKLAGDRDIIAMGFGAELATGYAYLARNKSFEEGK